MLGEISRRHEPPFRPRAMPRTLRVHFLPETLAAARPVGELAAVIDVLRASTTIAQALAAGAMAVVPCLTIDNARRAAAELALHGPVVLGGERGGLAIEGFDLGNSPAEYTPDAVGGKTVVFTTTNGTRALEACRRAESVLLAAAVNRRAVCGHLRAQDANVFDLVCAGTDGQITREDVLVAGAIIEGVCGGLEVSKRWDLGDSARLALTAWSDLVQAAGELGTPIADHLAAELGECLGGRNLIAIGKEADLAVAAALDSTDVVPVFDRRTGRITRLK